MQDLPETFGVGRNIMAYFNWEEPSRIYLNVYQQQYFIDLSPLNTTNDAVPQRGVEMLPVIEMGYDMRNGVQDLILKACELARNYPVIQNDLGNELNKVIELILSKQVGQSNKDDITLTRRSQGSTSTSIWQMLTDSEREELQRERRKKNAYKTALCRLFRQHNVCPYGEECVFAHGKKELRIPPQVHPKYKTQLCNKFSVLNYCPYGGRCQYIHQRVGEISKEDEELYTNGNSRENIERNHPSVSLQHPYELCNITKQEDKSPDSTVALGNHSSFDQHGGFSASLTGTNFNCSEEREQFLKGSGLSHPDGNESDRKMKAVANNAILKQLDKYFNNMQIGDNQFSRSCAGRIMTS